jgi:hypothetical protein
MAELWGWLPVVGPAPDSSARSYAELAVIAGWAVFKRKSWTRHGGKMWSLSPIWGYPGHAKARLLPGGKRFDGPRFAGATAPIERARLGRSDLDAVVPWPGDHLVFRYEALFRRRPSGSSGSCCGV